MPKVLRTLLSSLPFIITPAVLANGQSPDALSNIGPAAFAFTLAAALLMTLFARAISTHLGNRVAARFGAWRVRHTLAKHGADSLHDFLLPGAYGGLAKIDHVLLTAGGIVCVQSKHISGTVFADEKEAQWSNVDGTKRYRFLNPIIQNEGRTRALKRVVPDIPITSVVVFTGSVKFSAALPKNVIHVRDLHNYVEKFSVGECRVDDWDAVWMSVKAAALTDADTRKDFAAQLGFS